MANSPVSGKFTGLPIAKKGPPRMDDYSGNFIE
jgi:hypothetical protein